MRKRFAFLIVFVLIIGAVVAIHNKSVSPPVIAPTVKVKVSQPDIKKSTAATSFSKSRYSLTDPDSIWIVVNKQRPLSPKEYAPNDLVVPPVAMRVNGTKVRDIMSPALQQMFADAKTNGTPLRVASGYRSYSYQVGLYNGYVAKQGQAVADSQSARPGYSEHQTGLAADVSPEAGNCSVQDCFAATPAGQWLALNAYKYGFIIRYGQGLTPVTGYSYEPWHIRYVGQDLANEMHAKNILTIEEFFELGPAADY